MMNLYIVWIIVQKGSSVHCTDVPPALRKTACCALPIHSKALAYIDVLFSMSGLIINCSPSVVSWVLKLFLLLLLVLHPTFPFVIDFSNRRAVFVSMKRHSLFCTPRSFSTRPYVFRMRCYTNSCVSQFREAM